MKLIDGKRLASEIENDLIEKFLGIETVPTLSIIRIGDDTASLKYVGMKLGMAKKLGVVAKEVYFESIEAEDLVRVVENECMISNGVMVQLPIAGMNKEDQLRVLGAIRPECDVDGLNKNSGIVPATVLAVEKCLEQVIEKKKIVVLGSKGTIGSEICDFLINKGESEVVGFDKGDDFDFKNVDVVILATGVEGVIEASQLMLGTSVIDLGAPKSEMLSDKTDHLGFVTPVPGGVGPLTVISLFANLYRLSS